MKKANTARKQNHDFHLRLSEQVLSTLDKRRRREEDMPSRAEMIRRLILKDDK